jgi:hypothetical protein
MDKYNRAALLQSIVMFGGVQLIDLIYSYWLFRA